MTIEPVIADAVAPGTLIYSHEYRNIYGRLAQWSYWHRAVNHYVGDYARDEDSHDFHEVQVNIIEGFYLLLRSWLRPYRGISQERLPIYLGFFEFVHNVRKRAQALLLSSL